MRYLSLIALVAGVWASEPIGIDTLFGKEKGFKSTTTLALVGSSDYQYSLYPNTSAQKTSEQSKSVSLQQMLLYTVDSSLEVFGVGVGSYSKTEKDGEDMDLFLQSGIGYWLLEDIFTAYKRTQTYLYVPIELEGEIRSSPSLAWTYLVSYKHFVQGRNRTLTKASAILDTDMFFKQDKGFGFKASFGWKEQGNNINTFTRFVVDYWNIDSSPEVPVISTLGVRGVATEPKYYTLSIYIQHGCRF